MHVPPPQSWFLTTPSGLYCQPGDFYIDPVRPVDRAVITHGHSDHARAGHGAVVATASPLAHAQAPKPAPDEMRWGLHVTLVSRWLDWVQANTMRGSARKMECAIPGT